MLKKYSLLRLILYFLTLGTIGFGGSIALAQAMQSELVEKRRWLSEEEFLRGLTLSQLAPGPLAAQLAIYIGFVKGRILGATAAGIAFVFPSFLMVLIISMLYMHYGDLPLIQASLYGIGASVVGIIAASGYTLTQRTMKKKILLWLIYGLVFTVTVISNSTSIFLFIGAGLLTMFVYTKEKLSKAQLPVITPFTFHFASFSTTFLSSLPIKLFSYFFIAGSIAFGGGLAIVPFLQHGVVSQYHWLTHKQFVDAISVAMITPGPVVITSTFIGYIAGNISGAIIATIAIFLPVYLIVIFLTPLFNRHAENPRMIAFVEGVIAAAMASIAGSVILLGMQSVKDISTAIIALSSAIAMKFFKVPGIILVIAGTVIGIILHH